MKTFIRLSLLTMLFLLCAGHAKAGTATAIICPNNNQVGNYANCAPSPTLTFGKQGISTASMAIPISVNNCAPLLNSLSAQINPASCSGSGSLTLGATPFAISGTNASDFTFSLGGCTANLVIASGGTCSGTITFTPTASSGTNETATLTVTDNGTTSTQTMSLTGTSATVTVLTTFGCPDALSASTNYQLGAAPSCAGTVFTLAGSNVDINLNGFTATYCTASQTALEAFALMSANVSNTNVHNGTVNEGAGPCGTGLSNSAVIGPGVLIASSTGGSTHGSTLFNITSTIAAAHAKLIFEEGNNSAGNSTVAHDIFLTDNDSGSCGSVGCRDLDQWYPMVVNDSKAMSPTNFYNIKAVGGTQGTMVSTSPNCTFNYNLLNPGNSTATNANGFGQQIWGTGCSGTGTMIVNSSAGPCLSCRANQISSANNVDVTGVSLSGNFFQVATLDNDAEYPSCATNDLASTYVIQFNTAGSGHAVSNNSANNNYAYASAIHCPAYSLALSGYTNGSGPNTTTGNTWVSRQNGGTANSSAVRMDANQYTTGIGSCISAGVLTPSSCGFQSTSDTFSGDSSDVFTWYDGNPPVLFASGTFNKPATAAAGFHFFDQNGGNNSASAVSGPHLFLDPTFTGGTSKSDNNLSAWAASTPGGSASYIIGWTYTVTVQNTSSVPLSGATVTMTDAGSTVECNGTTNGSGVFTCPVIDTIYQAITGTYSAVSKNNYTLQITSPLGQGCATLNQSGKAITATTSETKQLTGCSGTNPTVAPAKGLFAELRTP